MPAPTSKGRPAPASPLASARTALQTVTGAQQSATCLSGAFDAALGGRGLMGHPPPNPAHDKRAGHLPTAGQEKPAPAAARPNLPRKGHR